MDLILATSLAGHDKGQVYVVIGQEGDSLLLANGVTKTCDKPKKKKLIHLQLIKKLPEEIKLEAADKELDDLTIKRILKCFNRRKENV